MGATHQLQALNTRIRIFGIIQDEMAKGVTGGVIFVEHEYRGSWYLKESCTHADMTSHSWGCYVSTTGKYKVSWEKDGWVIISEKQAEFTLPDSPPKGDIVFVVRRVEPTATPEYTVTPMETPSPAPTAKPPLRYAVVDWGVSWMYPDLEVGATSVDGEFMQLPTSLQREFVDEARMRMGQPLPRLYVVEQDPTWQAGTAMGLGAQLTPKFTRGIYDIMGFCQAVVVLEN